MRLILFLLLPVAIYGQQDSLGFAKENNVQRYDNFYKAIDAQERSQELYKTITETEKASGEMQNLIMKIEDKLILEAKKLDEKGDRYDAKISALTAEIDDPLENNKLYQSPEEIKIRGRRLKGQTQFDSRVEMHQLDPAISWQSEILKNCESVGIVVEKSKIRQLTDRYYFLNTGTTLGSYFRLCQDEPFYSQPVLGGGTGFVISDTTMVTARHVFVKPLSEYVVIFGYRLLYVNGVVENFFAKDNVYEPIAVVNNFYGVDAVEFSVNRKLNRAALKFGESQSAKIGDEIYMIGHPCGLPLKIAVNASISDTQAAQYFYTTLDSFVGNSGSPVFDAKTHAVIGILVSGEVDFQFNGNCYYSPVCKLPECTGEKVVRIGSIAKQR